MDLKELAEEMETRGIREQGSERSVVPRVPEPSLGQSRGLDGFAVAMAEDIVRSCLSEWGTVPPRSGCYSTVDKMAEELANVFIQAALQEACPRGREAEQSRSSEEFRRPSTPRLHSHRGPGEGEGETGTGVNPVRDDGGGETATHPGCSSNLQTSRDTQAPLPGLPQSGLPAMGSLDYPDAPPTTPLHPDMMKSRTSFSRQLKGGLAKEFLPSPPPPTPKDRQVEGWAEEEAEEGREAKVEDGRAEFVGRLLRSLSLECSERVEGFWKEEDLSKGFRGDASGRARDGPEDLTEPGARARIAAYAEALSDDIIGWVTRGSPAVSEPRLREEGRGEEDIRLLANKMAESISKASLNEVKMAV